MSGNIGFTETMRGGLHSPAALAHTALVLRQLRVEVSTDWAGGPEGMQGRILSGELQVPALCAQTLQVASGQIEILRQTADHACEMRYALLCESPRGERLRLLGVKDVRHQSGHWWPRALWVETTTLQVTVLRVPDSGAQHAAAQAPVVLATGTVRVYPADFARQLATLRSTGPQGLAGRLRTLSRFLRFFSLRLRQVYWHRRPQH